MFMGEVFDSREEIWFAMWCQELKNAGYITEWRKVNTHLTVTYPIKFEYTKTTPLKTKVKQETKIFTLLQGLEYTPDFYIHWTREGVEKFVSVIEDGIDPTKWFFSNGYNSIVEVKPIFDQHGKTARFSILQKVLYKLGTYVDLIIPEDLFKGTFMPVQAMDDFKYKKNPTGKNKGKKFAGDWKCDYVPKTLNEFLNGSK